MTNDNNRCRYRHVCCHRCRFADILKNVQFSDLAQGDGVIWRRSIIVVGLIIPKEIHQDGQPMHMRIKKNGKKISSPHSKMLQTMGALIERFQSQMLPGTSSLCFVSIAIRATLRTSRPIVNCVVGSKAHERSNKSPLRLPRPKGKTIAKLSLLRCE